MGPWGWGSSTPAPKCGCPPPIPNCGVSGTDPVPYSPRATLAAMQSIMGPQLPAGTDVSQYIIAANLIVNNVVVPHGTYYDDTLTAMENWLACHFAATVLAPMVENQAGKARVRYEEGRVGFGLNRTRYGQMAMMIDANSYLAALDNYQRQATQRRVHVGWLGVPWYRRLYQFSWWPYYDGF
jgi:hypothetical protein